MMSSPQGGPLSARLGARMGPEVVASILVVAVLVVVFAVALSGQRGAGAPPSSEPSLAVIVPSATAVPSPTPAAPSPSSSPSPTATPVVSVPPPSSTMPPEQAAAARAVLESIDQLLDERAGLQAELARSGTDSEAIADLLRQVNASIVRQDSPLADLAAYSSTADLARRIRAVNTATSDTVNRIQHTSPRNAKTYRDGAAEVIEKLQSLPALRTELAGLTG